MIIEHNPALQELALQLARPGAAARELAAKYPTGALVELQLPSDSWAAVREGSGELVTFVRPRDLPR
jgi:phosphohistidine phosphatase